VTKRKKGKNEDSDSKGEEGKEMKRGKYSIYF